MSKKFIPKKELKSSGQKPKVIVVLGPTASGKTGLGIKLAREFNGEIISADSRQVYRGMDIGTGKDLVDYGKGKNKVPYHLIDIVNPQDDFDLAKYQELVFAATRNILTRGKLPIIVGGSGLYLQAVVDNYILSGKPGDLKQRDKLEKLSAVKLFANLTKLKPEFAAKLNNSDKNNPRRLARYLEIAVQGESIDKRSESPYDFLLLGLDFPSAVLRKRISYRLLSRLEEGMIAEVQKLKKSGISDKRLEAFGLEYRYISRHLRGDLTYNEMLRQLEFAICHFAKRQKSWFKRWQKQGRKIAWVKKSEKASALVKKFIS
jgi:tRNA dimethylallyltransferase